MKNKKAPNSSFCYNISWRLCLPISNFELGGERMQNLFFYLWSSILAPILVTAVYYILEKLFDEWLDARHRRRRNTHKRRSKKQHKRH